MSYPTRTLHTVSVAFRLMDDFNGKSLSSTIPSFFVNNKPVTPIRKSDGLFVLIDICQLQESIITINSPGYCSHTITDFACLDARNPVMTVRLKPGFGYSITTGTTAYSGSLIHTDGSIGSGLYVELHTAFKDGAIRLRAVKKENYISYATLTNPYGLDYTGMTLSVSSKDIDGRYNVFTVIRRIDNNTYEIAERTLHTPSSDSIVQRVFSSFSDSMGRVLIPVEAENRIEGQDVFEASLHVSDEKNTYIRTVPLTKGYLKHFNEKLSW